jgi:hypothetical protein
VGVLVLANAPAGSASSAISAQSSGIDDRRRVMLAP